MALSGNENYVSVEPRLPAMPCMPQEQYSLAMPAGYDRLEGSEEIVL